jgi:WD40 repeat protein
MLAIKPRRHGSVLLEYQTHSGIACHPSHVSLCHFTPGLSHVGHQSDVDVVRWHPNCQCLATAGSDRAVRLWDVASGACVRLMRGLRGAPTAMAMHPDGKHVSTRDGMGWLVLSCSCWNLAPVRMASCRAHLVHALMVDRCIGKKIMLRDCEYASLMWWLCCPKHTHTHTHTHNPTLCAPQVAVGDARGGIGVWDLGSARRVASFKAHLGPVWSLSYSKGLGALLASGGW